MAFSKFYFFGDSLTDQGRLHDLTAATTIVTLPVEGAGYGEAFSNGPVHAEIMTGLLGAAANNYAVGGAGAIGAQTVEDYVIPRLGGQIPGLDIFLPDADAAALATDINLGGQAAAFAGDVAAGETPPEGAAAAFFIGLNDYSSFRPTSPETALAEATALVQGVVGATVGAAGAALARGVEDIIFYTLPSVRFFPLAGLQTPELVALGDQLFAAHNAALAQQAAPALQAAGAEVTFIDFARMSAEIQADPETYGLDAALFAAPLLIGTGGNPRLVEGPGGEVEAVFDGNPLVAGADPETVAFIDFVHPGAAIQGVWGVFSAASLTSEHFFFGDGDDAITGTAGADLVLAGAGNDRVAARGGADVVLAGLGDDRVDGGGGADILSGGAGCDVLIGGCGADVLAGGAGRDVARGGRGADLLIASPGGDQLFGDAGDDAFVLDGARMGSAAAGRMSGGAGEDTLYLILDAETRAAVEADLVAGAARQHVSALGLSTIGIEAFVFLDPADGLAGIDTPARLAEADLWGLV